jgi:protoporphyrinogen oxidase
MYDVAIVGGGVTGLTAAFHLNGYKVLVIEQADRLGGRILTGEYAGICFDLGMTNGYDPKYIPFSITPPRLYFRNDPIAILANGRLFAGDSPLSCITQAFEKTPAIIDEIQEFKAGARGIQNLSSAAYSALNAFLKVIHPGELATYSRKIHRDIFRRYYVSHHAKGNQELVDEYLHRIRADVKLGCSVTSVGRAGDHLELGLKTGEEEATVKSRSVISATPANVARELFHGFATAPGLLENVDYARYTVVALVFDEKITPDISYVVTPDLLIDVFFSYSEMKNKHAVLVFLGHEASKKVEWMTEPQLICAVLDALEKACGAPQLRGRLLHHQLKKWKVGGTIISDSHLDSPSIEMNAEDENVSIAGDFTDSQYPYGIVAAINSAKKSATRISEYLARGIR